MILSLKRIRKEYVWPVLNTSEYAGHGRWIYLLQLLFLLLHVTRPNSLTAKSFNDF